MLWIAPVNLGKNVWLVMLFKIFVKNIVTERTAYVLELIYFTIRCFCTDNCELSQKLSWSQMYPLRKDDILSSLRWEARLAFYGLPGRFQSGRRGLKLPKPVMISVSENVTLIVTKFSLLPYFLLLKLWTKRLLLWKNPNYSWASDELQANI